MITKNLKEVEEKIQKACLRSGRDRKEVTLIAVSKTKPVSMIEEVYNEGIRDFGENKICGGSSLYDSFCGLHPSSSGNRGRSSEKESYNPDSFRSEYCQRRK